MRQQQPFVRSERVWNDVTQERVALRHQLTRAQNEIDRLRSFLTLLAAPVPFPALVDVSLKAMAKEFSTRLLLAQAALRGDAVPASNNDPAVTAEPDPELSNGERADG